MDIISFSTIEDFRRGRSFYTFLVRTSFHFGEYLGYFTKSGRHRIFLKRHIHLFDNSGFMISNKGVNPSVKIFYY